MPWVHMMPVSVSEKLASDSNQELKLMSLITLNYQKITKIREEKKSRLTLNIMH